MTCEATPARPPRHALPHGKIGAARGEAALLNVILNPSLHTRVNSVKDLLFVFATEKSRPRRPTSRRTQRFGVNPKFQTVYRGRFRRFRLPQFPSFMRVNILIEM